MDLSEYLRRQMNLMLWLSLISVTVLLIQILCSICKFWSKARLIPGPNRDFFYGRYRLVSGTNFNRLLSNLHEEYGPVVKLWLGPIQFLVSIKDPELIKEVLLKAEDKSPSTGRAFHLSFGQSSLFMSSFNEIGLVPGTGSDFKLIMDDNILHYLPNPKIAFVDGEKGEIEVHPV